MDAEDDAPFSGLAEFLVGLVDETAEAVHRSQIAQNDDERELRAVAALELDVAAEQLVTVEAAQALEEGLLNESGAGDAWASHCAEFARLVQTRLGVALTPPGDYTERGLTAAGHAKILAAARHSIAAEQLHAARRLLGDGVRHVKFSGGSISVKVELRTHRSRSVCASHPRSTIEAKWSRSRPLAARILRFLGLGTKPDLRILVRPARRDDGRVAGVFGEVKIDFLVL